MKSMSPMKGGRIPSLETPPPKQRSARVPKENVDPGPTSVDGSAPPYRSPTVPLGKTPLASKTRSPLPPRPPLCPSGNPLKRKLTVDNVSDHGAAAPAVGSDSGVQVILRMRPLIKEVEEGDQIMHNISSDSVSILDHTFTFDSVADVETTQQDIFQLVGVPLVENCLAGFNSSIFAYGQTGSGKTYTMWGPLNALSKDNNRSNSKRGLTPRVFELLFARMKEEQIKHSNKQLNYQCRCSLLEIYNEQITDLLEPAQKNLQIRKDLRTGVYVENLTEDYVCSVKDVIQLLVKGLENRRTGATSINAESSRSHCVFTCIVESRSKCTSDGLSSVRMSRMNLVDLAGSERQKQTGAAGERLKEAGNINRSLSQLGNLINILAEVSQSGKQRHIPYRDSRLTFLLQESLGGNAKLAMICAVSPSLSCKNETFSTLRFAQRAKAIKNKAVINEVTQDDVNVLREQIRQLKDELLRVKSNGVSVGNNGSFSTGWNARRSLNILRRSLRPMSMQIEEDNDEEMEIDDEDVEKPFTDGAQAPVSNEVAYQPTMGVCIPGSSAEEVSRSLSESKLVAGDVLSKGTYISMEVCESENKALDQLSPNHADSNDLKVLEEGASKSLTHLVRQHIEGVNPPLGPGRPQDSPNCPSISNMQLSLSIVPCLTDPSVEVSAASFSAGIETSSRKILKTSSSMSASQKHPHSAPTSVKHSTNVPMTRTSIKSLVPTEQLASSLHQGLQVFHSYQQMSHLGGSPFKFKPIEIKSPIPLAMVDFGTQTSQEISEGLSLYICNYCKNKTPSAESKGVGVDTEFQLVPVDEPSYAKKPLQVPKAVENVLAGAIRREMALEDYCAKKDAEISHLNRLVQQYKHERKCNTLIEQAREGKISRLEDLINGILPSEHFMKEEFVSLANEHKILKEKYENHPDVLKMMIEMKRLQNELDSHRNFCEYGEKEVLSEEIRSLRYQLQYYIDSSSIPIRKQSSLLKLTYLNNTMAAEHSTASCHNASSEPLDDNDNFEEERRRWSETESKWISLAEELRRNLEAAHSLSENLKMELDSEKKCSQELKEALETAMQGRACVLDQYADLQEKHIQLLAWNRKTRDAITDVKKAATSTGVKDAEFSLIDALATEISALKEEREKERHYWREENKGLQAQLQDTAEAVQAAGELLVRLKEAEEATAIAQKRTIAAEEEAKEAHLEIESLKKHHGTEIAPLNQFLAKSCLPKEDDNIDAKYEGFESFDDQQRRLESKPFHLGNDNEFCGGAEHPSWFSPDYDRCNI